ncbi:MAG: sorbosone dehydrogenase family protein [Acidobacteria bacterium]|nr:sorbosone dehydrogenase family protein [Acidobacteriota bacterium]
MQLRFLLPILVLAASAQTKKYKLPAPNPAGQVSNPAKVIPQPAGKTLKGPDGFVVEEFAGGFQKPRGLVQLSNGTILVSESVAKGSVVAIAADKSKKPLIEGLDRPFGMAFSKGYLYVGEPESIKRYKLDVKTMKIGPGEELAALKGYGKGHWTRSIAIDEKAKKMYVSVGSAHNIDLGDPEDRNAIIEYDLDGKNKRVFATGLRNAVCVRLNPENRKIWTTVQERDGLGDELVPDFFTSVTQGAFYGWPYAYAGPNEEPRHKGVKPEAVARTVEPDVLLAPHASAMDFVFYTGKMFPAKYRNGAFIAYRGSSGRSKRLGYAIMFVPFAGGKPTGEPEPFVTGWMLGENIKEVWGRPVGVTQLNDGSLLVSEDGNNKLFRVSYKN